MRALLAVDESVRSSGVAALRQSLIESGLDVAMLAADRPWATACQRPETIERVDGDDANPVYTLDGTLMDCVHVALGSGAIGRVDMVIAGFGRSLESYHAPGTDSALAAAQEAALMGRAALSLDLDGRLRAAAPSEADFRWCGLVVSEILAWAIASPVPVRSILRLGVTAGIAGGGLALADTTGGNTHPRGHITVTPVNLDAGPETSSTSLQAWVEAALAAINPRLGMGGKCLAGCCG